MNIRNIFVQSNEPSLFTQSVKGIAWLNGSTFKYVDENGVKQTISGGNNAIVNLPSPLNTNSWDVTNQAKIYRAPLNADITLNVISINGDTGELILVGNGFEITFVDAQNNQYIVATELVGATFIEYKNFNNIMAVSKKTLTTEVFQSISFIDCTSINNTQAVMRWNNTAANNYILEYKVYGASTWFVASSNIQTVDVDGFVTFTLTGLSANTDYDVRLKAEYNNGFSSYKDFFLSNKIITGITNTYVSTTQQNINWDIPAGFFTVGTDTYNLQVRVIDGQVGDIGNYGVGVGEWIFMATPDIGLGYQGMGLSNLTLGRTYEARVGFYKKGFRSNLTVYSFTHQAL